LKVYLDASFVIPLFVIDAHTDRARAFLRNSLPELIVSDFAAAEFASGLGRRARMREMTTKQARTAFAHFDGWVMRSAQRAETISSDIARAEIILRQLDLPMRAPDALNITLTQRLGATLATFDNTMADCARRLGVNVAGC
jgi:predicted nucleic acid-binding protein